MNNIKAWIRGTGVVLICVGFMCLPLWTLPNPKVQTSIWPFAAATGSFVKIGMGISAVGLILFIISLLVREDT